MEAFLLFILWVIVGAVFYIPTILLKIDYGTVDNEFIKARQDKYLHYFKTAFYIISFIFSFILGYIFKSLLQ